MRILPTHGMVLAAGLGLRMRPLTDTIPKALVQVAGRTLIDHALDRFADAGVAHCVVNLHHLAALVREHLSERIQPKIFFSDETDLLLETGGGIAKALPHLGTIPFFVANADALWRDGPGQSALHRLATVWDDACMDALLLLIPITEAHGGDGCSDFYFSSSGRPERGGGKTSYMFTGVQILHPRLFRAAPAGAFSLNILYDCAAREERLATLIHDGIWFHVGTPAHVVLAERHLARL